MDPNFFAQQKEKRETKKKERVLKQKLLKGCHLKRLSKCYCFSHSRASRIQRFFLSANHGAPRPLHFEIHFSGPDKPSYKQYCTDI